ncbi:MAG TPA: NADH-quinone oxidoreductase subunit J [Gemmatimonadaceae bacterium]|nr:NADH-quinone oxidoreductase subunit J [Gemmatimonadaceae bacterium]
MTVVFYISAAIAILATILTITRLNPVHALLYLVISLLAVAIVFFTLGAPFVAALEVIIYAGAIMVLFIFVVMMLNLGGPTVALERRWVYPGMWIGPTILAAILVAEVIVLLMDGSAARLVGAEVAPKQVALALYQPYLIGVELASFLLMAGVVGAYHLGARRGAQQDAVR